MPDLEIKKLQLAVWRCCHCEARGWGDSSEEVQRSAMRHRLDTGRRSGRPHDVTYQVRVSEDDYSIPVHLDAPTARCKKVHA